MRSLADAIADCRPKMRSRAFRFVRDPGSADDLVQETLTRALEKQATFREGTDLAGWLFVIMRNCFYNSRRSDRDIPTDDAVLMSALMAEQPRQESIVALRELSDAIAGLSETNRDILISIALDGDSYEDTSKRLSMQIGTIRSRLSRTRDALELAMNGEAA